MTTEALLLALDQGTTNTKAVLVDAATGHVRSVASRPVGITFPTPGWVEQDAGQLWHATAKAGAPECLAAVDRCPVVIAIASQCDSVVAWRRSTGQPLGPALGWHDACTAQWCVELAAGRPSVAGLVRTRTGLSLDPMFSPPKMRWLLDAAVTGGSDSGDVLLGVVDSWLLWKLTGRHVTEAGNASRMLLFDLETLRWDPALLDVFGVPAGCMPQVLDSDGDFGATVASSGLPVGIPVAAVLADSHAALYHHGCVRPGAGKATYGTGSSVMTPCDGPEPAPLGIATTLAWLVGGRPTFAREGNIVASGSALDWMAATLGCPPGESGGKYLTRLAEGVPDAGGVTFVSAFSGLGAPYWDRSATGIPAGVTGCTIPAHLPRAASEAGAHQIADVVEAIESDGRASVGTLHAKRWGGRVGASHADPNRPARPRGPRLGRARGVGPRRGTVGGRAARPRGWRHARVVAPGAAGRWAGCAPDAPAARSHAPAGWRCRRKAPARRACGLYACVMNR